MKNTLKILMAYTMAITCLGINSFANPPETAPQQPGNKGLALSGQDFSFAYWLNGYRKHASDRSEDILCFETGHFGLTLDLNNLGKAKFGRFNDKVSYEDALKADVGRMQQLQPAELVIEVRQGTNTYRATRCELGKPENSKRLDGARLWESGRLVQHFDLQKVVLEDATGQRLGCKGTLDVVVWPESLTLSVELIPQWEPPTVFENSTIRIFLKTSEREWESTLDVPGVWAKGDKRELTLPCDVRAKPLNKTAISVQCNLANGPDFPVDYVTGRDCYVAKVGRFKRNWRGGYTDIRNYDEFKLVIDNTGNENVAVPFLLDFYGAANITGLVPMLCDENGVPTGIPVQLSKNWHYQPLGEYLRAYAQVPAKPGKSTYTLRIVYGFYGTLPSASHAQLSLVGYGGHGRWEQLAIGCWGETLCLDMDMSCVPIAITDVRMLMARAGLNGGKWNWTDAGWGGDWLNARDQRGEKHYFSEMKTAYRSHGPCLTEVLYDGKYGSQREVDVKATVRTLRTDDYARTFQTLNYGFNATNAADKGWLFKMGGAHGLLTPHIAYGHREGLIAEQEVPINLKKHDLFLNAVTLTNAGPWWVTFPGAGFPGNRNWGTGTRGLIIRSYRATFGGVAHSTPTISMPVDWISKEGQPGLNLLLVPPPGVTQFKPGDRVEMDLEWITIPRIADDYYGPNQALRKHLTEFPRSWKTVHREVVGNDLKVQVTGGTVLKNYPILIQATQPEVKVAVQGGVGMVPIRFEGLPSATGYRLYQQTGDQLKPLDQSVHGNDFWQTDLDPASGTYRLTYNLPLDGLQTSSWVLKK